MPEVGSEVWSDCTGTPSRPQLPALLQLQYLRELRGVTNGTAPVAQASVPQNNALHSSELRPMIGRFYGVVACIDISGFSNLSNLLDSQQLTMHINRYFGSMISIIQQWSGDIIKFAGDSLFVVWRNLELGGDTDGNTQDSPPDVVDRDIRDKLRATICRAISCVVQVHRECGCYNVPYQKHPSESTLESGRTSPLDLITSTEDIFTLTVHSGIGAGVIGSCDIGTSNRREFLIIGGPVEDVVQAMVHAPKDHIVASDVVWQILTSNLTYESYAQSLAPITINEKNVSGSTDIFHDIDVDRWSQAELSTRFINKNVVLTIDPRGCMPPGPLIISVPQNFIQNFDHLADMHSHEAFRLLGSDPHVFGEIRPIVTIFIKVHDDIVLANRSRVVMSKLIAEGFYDDKFIPDAYGFLGDNDEFPLAVDGDLVNKLQCHLAHIVETLSAHRGQLRQFIYDDKGLIAIGTFGLKGSTSVNIANSAMLAVSQLSSIYSASDAAISVGVTHGKAFCGLVGATQRFEYAVLGSCVNLAARLMFHAKPGQVLCDSQTRDRSLDAFSYAELSKMIAKGYSHPVDVYELLAQIDQAGEGVSPRLFQNISPMHNLEVNDVIRQKQLSECLDLFAVDMSNPRRQRVILVEGRPKYGMSLLLKSLTTTIRTKLPRDHVLAFTVINTFHCKNLFSVWKCIIDEIRVQLAERMGLPLREFHEMAVQRLHESIRSEVYLANDLLPAELRLQSAISIAEDMNTSEPAMVQTGSLESTLVMKLSTIFFQLISSYVNSVGGCAINIILDNAQWIDLPSWNLLVRCMSSFPKVWLVLGHRRSSALPSQSLILAGSPNRNGNSPLPRINQTNLDARKADWFVVDIDSELNDLVKQSISSISRSWKPVYHIRRVELGPLDEKMTRMLASSIISKSFIDINKVASVIYGVSRGDPMIIYQLSSVIQLSTKDYNEDLAKIVKFQSAEDIIVHRFDSLPAKQRMVLEIASCLSNLVNIQPQLVYFVAQFTTRNLDGDSTFLASLLNAMAQVSLVDITESLSKLAASKDFIRPFTGIDNAYEFHTDLEKSVIQGLMVDAKKDIIMNALAEYLQSNRGSISDTFAYYLTGCHYAWAHNYRKAIVWYSIAASSLEEQGYLQQSYLLNYEAMHCFDTLQSSHSIRVREQCSNNDMKVLCGDDQEVLRAIVLILLTSTRIHYITGSESFEESYDYTFKVFQSVVPFTVSDRFQSFVDEQWAETDIFGGLFYLEDTSPMCRLISTLILREMATARYSNTLTGKLLAYSCNVSNAAAFGKNPLHILRASVLHTITLSCAGRYNDMVRIAEQIATSYKFEEHHEQMIRMYGVDRTCQALAQAECCAAFYCARNQVCKVTESTTSAVLNTNPNIENGTSCRYLATIQELTARTHHILTIGHAYLPLLPALVLHRQITLALELFFYYYQSTGSAAFIYFKTTNATAAVWLTRLLVYHDCHDRSLEDYLREHVNLKSIESLLTKASTASQDEDLLSILRTSSRIKMGSSSFRRLAVEQNPYLAANAMHSSNYQQRVRERARVKKKMALSRKAQRMMDDREYASAMRIQMWIRSLLIKWRSRRSGNDGGSNMRSDGSVVLSGPQVVMRLYGIGEENMQAEVCLLEALARLRQRHSLQLTALPFNPSMHTSFITSLGATVSFRAVDVINASKAPDWMAMSLKWCDAGLRYLAKEDETDGANVMDTRFQTNTLRHCWLKVELLCAWVLLKELQQQLLHPAEELTPINPEVNDGDQLSNSSLENIGANKPDRCKDVIEQAYRCLQNCEKVLSLSDAHPDCMARATTAALRSIVKFVWEHFTTRLDECIELLCRRTKS